MKQLRTLSASTIRLLTFHLCSCCLVFLALSFPATIAQTEVQIPEENSQVPEKDKYGDATLTWSPGSNAPLSHYLIYYDTKPGPPFSPSPERYAKEGPPPILIDKNITQTTLHNLKNPQQYYFSVTSISTDGVESSFATPAKGIEVSHTEPNALPQQRSSAQADSGNTLSPGDIISLHFTPRDLHDDLNGNYQIDSQGNLNLPKLKPIPVADISLDSMNKQLAERINEQIQIDSPPELALISQNNSIFIRDIEVFNSKLNAFPQQSPLPLTKEANVLSPGDTISIRFDPRDLHDDLNGIYLIDTQGNLTLPGVNSVPVTGISLDSLNTQLAKRINEQVPVDFPPEAALISQNRFVFISKGVNYPGWYRLSKKSPIQEIISLAGGLIPGTTVLNATITRKSMVIPYGQALPLQSFDILSIGDATINNTTVNNGDLLYIVYPKEVTVENQPTEKNYFKEQVEVDRHGYIFLPSQGNIPVAGMTTEQISQQITDNLPRYLSRSDMAYVNIVEKRHYVKILGHVKEPGWHNISESANVQSAINSAGGIVDGALLSKLAIFRLINKEKKKINADLYYYSTTGDDRMLPVLHENDEIFIPIAPSFGTVKRTLGSWNPPDSKLDDDDSMKVRLFGAVQSPGLYESHKNMTLLDLIIAAGGGRDDVDLSNTLIIRDGKTTKHNLKQLVEVSAQLPEIRGGDVVQVGRMEKSGFKSKTSKDKARIFGAIQKSGGYVVQDETNLLDLLTMAGGEMPNADLSNILLLRRNGNIEVFNIKAIFDNPDQADTMDFPSIGPGDTVKVGFLLTDTYREKPTPEQVRIFGAIEKAGAYQHTDNMNILDLILAANGETNQADLSNIKILRAKGTTELYNMKAELNKTGADSITFPLVSQGDTVHIGHLIHQNIKSRSDKIKIRIFGAISRPDGYELKEDMNLIDLITEAGGETLYADLTKVVIYRPGGGSEEFDFKAFLNGNGTDQLPIFNGGEAVHIPHQRREGFVYEQSIAVTGPGCNSDGIFPFEKPMTVMKAIARAGGMNDFADSDSIMIIRLIGGKQENIPFNYDSGVRGHYPEMNILLQPDDIVYVP